MSIKTRNKKIDALFQDYDNTWELAAKKRLKDKYWLIHVRKIAINLLQYMKKNGITKEALAVDLCIDNSTMNKVLKGQFNLDLKLICDIGRKTGVKPILL